MNVRAFSLLSCSEQVDLLQKEAVFIGKRLQNKLPVVIYQLDDFYVEIVYYKYRLVISSIRCTKSTKILDPYLERINIEGLISTRPFF